jgi:uncharacterized delta-60 repeat protein
MAAAVIAATTVLVAAGNPGAPGTPDPGFGKQGRVVTVLTRGDPNLIAAQFDSVLWVRGTLWVAGASTNAGPWHWSSPSRHDRFSRLLLRYLPDGRLDPSFGRNGILRRGPWDWFDYDTTVLEVALPDGSVIATRRRVVQPHDTWTEAVVRLRADGSLERRFGHDGVVRLRAGKCDRMPRELVRQPDGKLVALVTPCEHQGRAGTWFALARLLPDGRPDPSFGTKGIAAARVGPATNGVLEGTADDLVLQPDGKLLVAGLTGPGESTVAVARFDADGALDRSFATAGVAQLGQARLDTGPKLLVRTNGDLVVSMCEGQPNQPVRVMLYRLDSTGAPVTSWGVDGAVRVERLSPHGFDSAPIHAAPGGKILVTGQARVARLDDEGVLDVGFGEGGYLQTPVAPQSEDQVLVQPDGKIVYAGKVRPTAQQRGFLLQRSLG